jgi:hypothetical protein
MAAPIRALRGEIRADHRPPGRSPEGVQGRLSSNGWTGPCKHAPIEDENTRSAGRTHWVEWHHAYDDPSSSLSRRLIAVRRLVGDCLDVAPEGEISVVSLCAGDGRDLLGILEHHTRRHDVRALLIELDEGLVHEGRRRIDELGLTRIAFLRGDAGDTNNLGSFNDVQLVLACGIFGNVAEHDIRSTIEGLSVLLAEGGSTVWTRHRMAPDLTPSIRDWFVAAGFEETEFVPIADSSASVGANRLIAKDLARSLPRRLFEFIGDGAGGLC